MRNAVLDATLALAVAIIMILALPVALFAHGSGASIEQVVGGYLVDIGYEPEEIAAGAQARFDFALSRQEGEAVAFDRVFVRIEGAQRLLFAGGIGKAELGGTGLSIRFPEEGQYTLFARFESAGETLAEIEVPIAVAAGESGASFPYLPIGAALVVGAVLGFFAGRGRKA